LVRPHGGRDVEDNDDGVVVDVRDATRLRRLVRRDGKTRANDHERQSPVAHDTETEALVTQSGRVFAATGQWEYPGPSAFGQVLVKKSKTSAWSVFEQTQSLRVQASDSFSIPSDQGLGPGHSLLVTQAIVAGRSRIQWLLDGADSFSLRNSYVLPAGVSAKGRQS
jgi:hypothetical protein